MDKLERKLRDFIDAMDRVNKCALEIRRGRRRGRFEEFMAALDAATIYADDVVTLQDSGDL